MSAPIAEATRRKVRRSLLYWLILLPLVLLNLFPFAVMLSTALKPAQEIFANPVTWIPSRLEWSNFYDMWVKSDFGRAVINSVIVTVSAVALAVGTGALSAYATFKFSGRALSAYRVGLLVTQMVSPIVLVIGLFRLFVGLGVVDTLLPLILTYAAFNMPFAAIMLENYYRTIPADLEQAAWMDGATRMQAMRRIFMPLARPAITVAATFAFVQVWNEFIVALTLLRSPEHATLPINVFTQASERYTIAWQQVMAGVLLATLPMTAVFIWLQRYLVQGLSSGAVK